MNRYKKGVTLLWALRSPCNLGCLYCYYGTLEDEINRTNPLAIGELSHVGDNDLDKMEVIAFVKSFDPKLVKRVFIAGGEPLNWKGSFEIIEILKGIGCEVIVCTNGLPLLNEKISDFLFNSSVDAISVSLDSTNFLVNDKWRPDKTNRGGQAIINGLSNFIKQKNTLKSAIKIGVYTVLTKENIGAMINTYTDLSNILIDYYIIQPISLASNHKYYTQLSLDESNYAEIEALINELESRETKVILPNKSYLRLMLQTLPNEVFHNVKGCFGGRDLFFIQPNGSIWDCPSSYKKQNTTPENYKTIVGNSADNLFSKLNRQKNTDCGLLSKECVNMWQLMAFDEILYK